MRIQSEHKSDSLVEQSNARTQCATQMEPQTNCIRFRNLSLIDHTNHLDTVRKLANLFQQTLNYTQRFVYWEDPTMKLLKNAFAKVTKGLDIDTLDSKYTPLSKLKRENEALKTQFCNFSENSMLQSEQRLFSFKFQLNKHFENSIKEMQEQLNSERKMRAEVENRVVELTIERETLKQNLVYLRKNNAQYLQNLKVERDKKQKYKILADECLKKCNESDMSKLSNTIRKLESLNETNERLIATITQDQSAIFTDLKNLLAYTSLLVRHQGNLFAYKLSRGCKSGDLRNNGGSLYLNEAPVLRGIVKSDIAQGYIDANRALFMAKIDDRLLKKEENFSRLIDNIADSGLQADALMTVSVVSTTKAKI
ncbi:hypothetical protein FGO68_gene9268 [Halteria grandinella]|uniref:Uncharacterized protein n=1 Tax=Halteria grandinella TaxID=5974 RepID=A0A8J8T5P7_HALGN|nr:hypothetical protein FGO68_gene9268 [Halteria grandinella]